jgi:octanoyl-[GcvH]:protein N-octanoyltransferase
MRLLIDSHPDRPAEDMRFSAELLRAVADRSVPESLRLFVPGPTAAFGRMDALRPGFAQAERIAAQYGYVSVVREAGGHAAAYDGGSVVVEVFRTRGADMGGLEERFADLTELLTDALGDLEIPVDLGELPGEYCPGRFSLHLPGGPKVAGVAQRIVRGATLTAAILTVAGGDRLREVIAPVYAALGESVDPAAAGALTDHHPAISVTQVTEALRDQARRRYRLST